MCLFRKQAVSYFENGFSMTSLSKRIGKVNINLPGDKMKRDYYKFATRKKESVERRIVL